MPACSVARLCAAAAPNASATDGAWTGRVGPGAAVCAPFNLLATVCAHDKGMGGMAGCRTHYAGMCAEGSVVAQCREVPGLAQLPTTKAVNDAVRTLPGPGWGLGLGARSEGWGRGSRAASAALGPAARAASKPAQDPWRHSCGATRGVAQQWHPPPGPGRPPRTGQAAVHRKPQPPGVCCVPAGLQGR